MPSNHGDKVAEAKQELKTLERFAELENDEQVKEYRRQDEQIAKMSKETQALKAKLKEADQQILEANSRYEHWVASRPTQGVKAWKVSQSRKSNRGTALLALNDWHCEERVDPETVNGLNEFNPDIADRRIKRTIEKSLQLIENERNLANYNDLVVWLGGDMITGYIHEELRETNFYSPIEATRWVAHRVINGLKTLEEHGNFEHIRVVANHGNHGRVDRKKQIKTSAVNSFEWGVYHQIADKFDDNDKFSFNICKGQFAHEVIQDTRVRFFHGDQVRYAGGVGGLTIPMNKRIKLENQKWTADLNVFGHFHQFMWHKDFVACGALIGFSDWTNYIGASYEPPSQTLIMLSRGDGPVSVRPIWCEPNQGFNQPRTSG